MEHESDSDTNSNWCTRYSHQRIGKAAGEVGNKRTSEDHPNYSIVEIGQNSKKSPGDLRRLTVTQTPVENPQLLLLFIFLASFSYQLTLVVFNWNLSGCKSPQVSRTLLSTLADLSNAEVWVISIFSLIFSSSSLSSKPLSTVPSVLITTDNHHPHVPQRF